VLKLAGAFGLGLVVAAGFGEYRLSCLRAELASEVITRRLIVRDMPGANEPSVAISTAGKVAGVMLHSPASTASFMAGDGTASMGLYQGPVTATMSTGAGAALHLDQPRKSVGLSAEHGVTVIHPWRSASFPASLPPGDVAIPD
jgi:hypothetical protein